jgi:hypothetical protein
MKINELNSWPYTSRIFDRPDPRIRTADFPAGLIRRSAGLSSPTNVPAGPVEIPSKNLLAIVDLSVSGENRRNSVNLSADPGLSSTALVK